MELLSKNLFSEQILLKRRGWPFGIGFFKRYTWQDENSKCWCVSGGLIYKSVRSLFPLCITSNGSQRFLFRKWAFSELNSSFNNSFPKDRILFLHERFSWSKFLWQAVWITLLSKNFQAENFAVSQWIQKVAKFFCREFWIAVLNAKFNFVKFHFLKFAKMHLIPRIWFASDQWEQITFQEQGLSTFNFQGNYFFHNFTKIIKNQLFYIWK